MNTKDIEKREELCRLLNMNFDEADELFSDETMQSMQMAQMNGGGSSVTLKLYEYIASGAAAELMSGLYEDIKSWLFGKPTTAGGAMKIKNGDTEITISFTSDKNIQIHELKDSTTGMSYRGIIITSPKASE